MLLDIHTHRGAPYPEGIVSLRIGHEAAPDIALLSGQLYSAGIHPWDTAEEPDETLFSQLDLLAADPQVAAIGECGVDIVQGGPMSRQLLTFRRHVELAEKVGKPLVIHAVKSYDIIMGLKRDLNPVQPWIIHGFRGKPSAALQIVGKGIYLSFGEKFNPEAVTAVPENMILAETDESALPIEEIIANLSGAAGHDLLPAIRANAQGLFLNSLKRLRQPS